MARLASSPVVMARCLRVGPYPMGSSELKTPARGQVNGSQATRDRGPNAGRHASAIALRCAAVRAKTTLGHRNPLGPHGTRGPLQPTVGPPGGRLQPPTAPPAAGRSARHRVRGGTAGVGGSPETVPVCSAGPCMWTRCPRIRRRWMGVRWSAARRWCVGAAPARRLHGLPGPDSRWVGRSHPDGRETSLGSGTTTAGRSRVSQWPNVLLEEEATP